MFYHSFEVEFLGKIRLQNKRLLLAAAFHSRYTLN